MPYIIEEERQELDEHIDKMADAILGIKPPHYPINPHNFAGFLGRINYCFSRILMIVMRDVSYAKVAMATGVLENIKQEFYERVARPYENRKIAENGDIPEYK
jgi:hypothetical protein